MRSYPGVQRDFCRSLPASAFGFLCSLPRIPRCHEYTLILLQLVTPFRGHWPSHWSCSGTLTWRVGYSLWVDLCGLWNSF